MVMALAAGWIRSMKLSVRLSHLLLWLLLAALAAGATDTNWPQFRGPSASGVGAGAPPTEWNVESGKNIRWKTAIPGLGHSSPVVWGDRIFLTSAVPASGESSLKVGLYGDIAPVKGRTRAELQRVLPGSQIRQDSVGARGGQRPPKIMRHPKSTHANPTPATDGKHLVVFFGSEGLFTYDLNGKLLWKKDFGVLDSGFYMVPSAQWGFASSPVIHDNMVIIQADVQKDSFVAALDIKTGKEALAHAAQRCAHVRLAGRGALHRGRRPAGGRWW
jgi:outer membrane protein assembly factor BamB